MTQVNITMGRFQPFTNGHMSCVQYAYDKLGIPTVICMIDTPDNKVDEKHPFPSSMLLPLYKDLFEPDTAARNLLNLLPNERKIVSQRRRPA